MDKGLQGFKGLRPDSLCQYSDKVMHCKGALWLHSPFGTAGVWLVSE